MITAVMLLVAVPAFAGGSDVAASKSDNASANAQNNDPGWQGNPNFGDQDKPQPKSGADMNPGGANNGGDCGAYCSTRNGDPSLNGNGNQANGKPCAGCVGHADNKNPPGQFKDGSDHNNGYECDGNNGIAKTNPAHTGCKGGSTTGGSTGCPSTGTTMSSGSTGCSSTSTTGSSSTTTTGGSSSGCPSTGTSMGTGGSTGCGTTTGGTTVSGTTTGRTTGGNTTNGTNNPSTGQVLGVVLERPNPGQQQNPAVLPTQVTNPGRPTEVEGVQLTQPAPGAPAEAAAPQPLARTGAASIPLALSGMSSIATGFGALFAARKREEEMIRIADRLQGHIG